VAEATVETVVTGGPALVRCHHCDHAVPAGDFCGYCGAHLAVQHTASRARGHFFAAAPGEHLFHFNVITTLFPHLPHRRSHAFLWGLVGGFGVIAVLAGLHLFAAATAVAALLLPVLYLLYLREVEVYEHEPIQVLLLTFGSGIVLGAVSTLVIGPMVTDAALRGEQVRTVLISGLALPVVDQVLMLAGPLLLLTRRHFNETLDGLAFGVASALGYSMAALLVAQWPVLSGPLFATGSVTDWALNLTRDGILVAVVNASTTGLITASIWLRRHGRGRGYHESWRWGVPAAVIVALVAQIVLGTLSAVLPNLFLEVVVWGIAAAVLIVYLRLVLHHALLEEGAEHEVGPVAECTECHRMVPTMLFCPACGAARSASPKGGRAPAPA
jgi:RsiW-degrading membrane proteinase PrsW (M82 family)